MPRTARKYSKQIKIYHVIIKGINEQDIWLEKKDKQQFLNILKGTQQKYNFDLYAIA